MKRLTLSEKILGATLGLLLILAGIAWWKTAPSAPGARKTAVAAIASADLVDQTTYVTAQRLAQVAITPEEQTFSQSSLPISDHELDLPFTQSLPDVEAHPPP